MTEDCCETCRFWQVVDGPDKFGDSTGRCRRKAPSPTDIGREVAGLIGDIAWGIGMLVPLDKESMDELEYRVFPEREDHFAYWPMTSHDKWCGEFETIQAQSVKAVPNCRHEGSKTDVPGRQHYLCQACGAEVAERWEAV